MNRKSLGCVRERKRERVSEWALGPWLALFFFLSLSLTITLQLNACVCTCRHAYVYVCIMLTHSHMCHTVESPPNREIQWEREREMERANVQERARAALLSAPQKLSHSTHTTFKYNSASSSNCRRGPRRQSRINYKKIKENHQLNSI